MADQLDRDYELLSYNTHPAQLFIYELRNNYIRHTNEQAESAEKGEQTIFTAFTAELEYPFTDSGNKPKPKKRKLDLDKNFPLKNSPKSTFESPELPAKPCKTTKPARKTDNSTISSKKEDPSSLPTQLTPPIEPKTLILSI